MTWKEIVGYIYKCPVHSMRQFSIPILNTLSKCNYATDTTTWSDMTGKHLISCKDWPPDALHELIGSALRLKAQFSREKYKKLDLLRGYNMALLMEVPDAMVQLCVTRAARLLGAHATSARARICIEEAYKGSHSKGKIILGHCSSYISALADMIFVNASTHYCVKRFSDESNSPVVCTRSRVHQPIQALATLMTILEEYRSLKGITLAYIGSTSPVLNSYIVLCPIFGMDIKFMCCCKEKPVSPLTYHEGHSLCREHRTRLQQCLAPAEALQQARAVVSGPCHQPSLQHKLFHLSSELLGNCDKDWIYFHTFPKGPEVSEELFRHGRSRSLQAVANMTWVAAACMARLTRNVVFT